MAIQMRRGDFADFDPDMMSAGEFAVVVAGDTDTETGKAVYICFAPGDVQRLNTQDEVEADIDRAMSDSQTLRTVVDEVLSHHPEWMAIVADGSITTAKLADGSVTTAKLADRSVTAAKLALSSVATDNIENYSVTTAKLDSEVVTTSKLGPAAVRTEKIYPNAVTTDKIADSAVTAAKISSNAVTTAKLANNAVTTAKLANNAVTTDQIEDDAVTTAKIEDNAVSATKLDATSRNIIYEFTISNGHLNVDDPLYGYNFTGMSGASSRPFIQATDSAGYRILREYTSSTNFGIYAEWGGTSYDFSSRTISVPSSDIRLKENVKDSEVDALEEINRVKIREFDWKDGRHQRIGFIADELEEIDPGLSMGGGYDEDGVMLVKSVDTFYMQGYEVRAIQQLSAMVDMLTAKVEELETRLAEVTG